jgi:membrane protein implicated in regulation of membrane protease activity
VAAFVIIGGLGLAIVVISLLFGDLLDGVFESAHFDVADGWLSTPVLGAFLTAFGFAGALLLRGLELSLLGASAGGLAAGLLLGGVTLTLVRALMNMPTDPTPRTGDLIGTLATVVTRIPEGGLGEVALTASGQRMKLSARSDSPIASGTTVVVVDVTSPTSVVVTESGF